MKVISFDVGIKNMAYCIFETDGLKIADWNILNLLDEPAPVLCECITKKNASCGKKAKYEKNGNYCEKHAKLGPYNIPTKRAINKMTTEGLQQLCKECNIPSSTKKANAENLKQFFKNTEYNIIKIVKASANDINLIQVGRNMNAALNNITGIETVTHVVIENQISPIATRMKTIQGMLAQYFIMKTQCEIEFVSSANKLKDLIGDKTDYKTKKNNGILFCAEFLKNECFANWTHMLHKKKDDLADCFLQGIWYLKRQNIISYAENLKINSV